MTICCRKAFQLRSGALRRDGGKPLAILQTSHDEFRGQLSPNGKWLAYVSDESSRNEVYIRAFPGERSGAGGKWQVSDQGGGIPRWRGDGKELFYVTTTNRLMAAAIGENATSVQAGAPRELFTFPTSAGTVVGFTYDVTADGQRFLGMESAAGSQAASAPLTVIVNWQAGLKK
jgi:eukaryotic-like serine/threonine-protein kinase